jgi:hypothetical protein
MAERELFPDVISRLAATESQARSDF